MRTTTANYDTSNAVSGKEPVVRITIGGFTNKYTSAPFSGITGTDKEFLQSFSANFPKIDLLKQPFPKSGKFSFSVLDNGLDVTSEVNSNPPINQAITVDYGYQDLVIADFVTLETQKLTEPIVLDSDLQSYNFVSRDVRRLLKGNIGRKRNASTLETTLTNVATALSVHDAAGFVDPANLPNQFDANTTTGVNGKAYLKVENEIIGYTAVNTGTDDFTINVNLGRHVMSREGIANFPDYEKGTPVEQVFAFQNLYPTEALLYTLLTSDDGSGHAFYDLASFDDGFKGMGFETNITSSEVDIEGIERLGWKFFNNGFENCMQILISEETNGVDWIIENILKPGGLYMYVDNGVIKIKSLDRLDLITNFSAEDDLVKDDLVNGRLESFALDPKTLLNRINFTWEIDPITRKKSESWEFKLDDSVTQYGAIEEPFILNSPLVVFASGSKQAQTLFVSGLIAPGLSLTNQVKNIIARRWLYTFDNPLGVASFKVMPDKWLLQPTDWITITSDKIPDTDAGTRGWTSKKFFITEQSISPLINPPVFSYKALTWEALTNVSDPYSFTTIAQGSINDTDIAFNADNTVTLDAEDGYWDEGSGGIAQANMEIIIIKLGITPPNTGSTHHWVKLSCHLINTTEAPDRIHHSQHYRAIRYLSSDSTEFDVEFIIFPIYDPDTSNTNIERIKIDWWDASHGSTERPSAITFKEIKYGAFGNAMTAVKELLN